MPHTLLPPATKILITAKLQRRRLSRHHMGVLYRPFVTFNLRRSFPFSIRQLQLPVSLSASTVFALPSLIFRLVQSPPRQDAPPPSSHPQGSLSPPQRPPGVPFVPPAACYPFTRSSFFQTTNSLLHPYGLFSSLSSFQAPVSPPLYFFLRPAAL